MAHRIHPPSPAPIRTLAATALLLAGGLVGWGSPSASDAAGALWKWKDAAGHVQYSDQPPPAGVREEQILGRPGKPVASRTDVPQASAAATATPSTSPAPSREGARTASGVDPELERRRQKAEAEQTAQKQAQEARQQEERARQCEESRRYQKSLDDGVRIARTGANGERELLDGAARTQEQARNRDVIDKTCR